MPIYFNGELVSFGGVLDRPEPPVYQDVTVTPSTQPIVTTADTGKVLRQVTTEAMPSGSVTVATPTVSSGGLVTASATVSAGYVSGNPSSKTLQLTTQAAKTVTPTTSTQTAVSSGVYTTGAVTVGAIPSQYIIPSGSQTVAENGTYTVTSLAQIVVAVPIQHYYTGSTAPSSSLGANGDIYLKA